MVVKVVEMMTKWAKRIKKVVKNRRKMTEKW
jgi:hypothetical protein